MRELLYTIGEIRASYRTASGQDLSDELLVTTLVRCTPGRLRTHIQLQLTPDTTYDRLKLTLMGWVLKKRPRITSSRESCCPHRQLWKALAPWTLTAYRSSRKEVAKERARAKTRRVKGRTTKAKGRARRGVMEPKARAKVKKA